VLRIVLTRGTERDLLAPEQRSEHGSGQNSRAFQLSFLGGATTVTGSQYLLDPKIKNLGFVTKIPTWRETVTLD
jgi:hypothetical protein